MNIGRNELCPCGSGKKYKKCCIDKELTLEPNEEFNEEDEGFEAEDILNFFTNFQSLLLRDKPHIKEYKRIRRLHEEILDSMMQYYETGKFKQEIMPQNAMEEALNDSNVIIIDSDFDTSTQLGAQAMTNLVVYKNAINMNCLTEEFINKNKFRKQEKIDFLKCMLNSEAGLFEIMKTDRELGQVYLKNIFTNKEYCITDIGLSSNFNNDAYYMYLRIITYKGISFGTGLNMIFKKEDEFINKWIEDNRKDYNVVQELKRFMELYNEYQRDNKGIRMRVNSNI